MKFFLSSLFLFFSLTVFANARDVINIDKKILQAKQDGKNIMFYFHIPDCPYCSRMLDENFKDKKIVNLIEKNFILIDIYTALKTQYTFNKFKGTAKDFAKHIGASAYPATLFMNTEKNVYYKSIGYRNIQEYVYEIEYLTTNSYKSMQLDEYILKVEMADED